MLSLTSNLKIKEKSSSFSFPHPSENKEDSLSLSWQLATAKNPLEFLIKYCKRFGQASYLTPEIPESFEIFGSTNFLEKKVSQLKNICIDDANCSLGIDLDLARSLQELEIMALLVLPVKTYRGHIGALVLYSHSPRSWDFPKSFLIPILPLLATAIDRADLEASEVVRDLLDEAKLLEKQSETIEHLSQKLLRQQQRLIHQEKMTALGQLMAGIAHEINNPLNFIQGNIQCLNDCVQSFLTFIEFYREKSANLDPEIRELEEELDIPYLIEDAPKMLKSIQVGVDRATAIIKSLRNFSRLDEAEKKTVNIHEGLENTLMILQHRLKNGIKVIKDYGEFPKIECYPGQLNQVFMNLLTNGIDALEGQENPEICIKTQYNHDCVTIAIADNGAGIPEAIRNQIFNPFFTTKPTGKGTGLGLSIAHEIVSDLHQGRLECSSWVDRGTEFRIVIPVALERNAIAK